MDIIKLNKLNEIFNENKLVNFLIRNIMILVIFYFSFKLLSPLKEEIRALALIISVETLAIVLSGIAVIAFTKLDFTKEIINNILGFIFLGVHLCVGLTILGVYLAQFG